MTKEQYLAKRAELLNQAQKFVDEGNIEDANAKMKEIETLDNQYEAAAKAQANLKALNDNTRITNIQNLGQIIDGTVIDTMINEEDHTDIYNSVEYRKAFMNNVLNGRPIPDKFLNVDTNTKTTEVGSVIPTTILEKIVEKLESTGMILPLVTRTAYKGGLAIPTSTVKPVATWTAEGKGSDKQKKTTGNIVFSYYKLRCAVSVSFEVSVVTLGVFETTIINNIAEAMTKALEQSIISGTGSGQPSGILKETASEGQNIEIAAADDVTYKTLVEAEAVLPLAYESEAVWCMTKKTFMKFIGMVDSNKQPIARVNYGINGRPERTLLGRTVVLNDYMTSLGATIKEDTVVAFLFNFKDYVLNTNYNITVKRYEDNDTDDQVTKAIMLVDGKVVDKNSLVTITKKSA
ncbi:phage major capsid protein [Tissierella praeacuta]|uniref:phage major capsid protein n=1 Tax=Tissierella praeacuta TaxID=43131 RepID=UPI0028A9B698|nr:phage major capsid protein [Tissierella praeacuta]